MKIIVCMKQVPAGTKVDIDPETGAMKRMSGDTRTNPYDLFALETAISLREKLGGTVTVLTMGPPQAETMMRDAYACGADDAVIHSVLLYIQNTISFLVAVSSLYVYFTDPSP